MRTKKNKLEQAKPVSTSSIPGVETSLNATHSASSDNSEKPNRISFNLTPENTPDWDRMLPKTKEQLKSLLLKKDVQKELGIDTEKKTGSSSLEFGKLECNGLFDLLELIEPPLASKVFGVPLEITSQAFKFSELHREKGSEALIPLLNKWAPFILKTWKDEIGAAMVLFSITGAQVRRMYQLNETAKPPAKKEPTPIKEIPKPVAQKEPVIDPEKKPIGKDVLEDVGFDTAVTR